jgi:hypothetical protein
MKVVNMTLTTLLCTIIQKNLKSWECRSFIEFAYSKSAFYEIIHHLKLFMVLIH